MKNNEQSILNSNVLCEIFCDRNRTTVLQTGYVAYNKRLAKTLDKISQKRENETFDNEGIYSQIINSLKDSFNINLYLKDFKNYEVLETDPFEVYLPSVDKQLLVPTSPSGGPILAAIMAVFDQFSVNANSYKNNPINFWQSVVECFKHAFGFSLGLGDPNFEPKVLNDIKKYFKFESLTDVKHEIKFNETHEVDFYKVNNFTIDNGVTNVGSHISVLGLEGESVSITSSIGSSFGSIIACNSTGIILNDALKMFSEIGKLFDMLQLNQFCKIKK